MSDLSPETITATLHTHRLGRPAVFYERIDSTNDVAKAQAAAGAAEGLLVVADEQTAGRGRGRDRTWWAPAGSSLLLSLLLRPPLAPAQAQQATMCLGLGALDGIARVAGLAPRLKWPNDVLFAGRKVGGMLAEMAPAGDRLAWLVVGLGLNVNLDFAATNPALAVEATSLSEVLGRPVPRPALLAAIIEATETWYERLLAGQSPHAAWAARLDTLGRQVIVTQPDGVIEGLAAGVDDAGALQVQTRDGAVHTIWAGDITMVRTKA